VAIRKNGERVPTEVHAIPFQHRGQPHVLTSARDITERKRAEHALRASEEQYRAIFNASADALMLWNSRLQRVDVNPAHEKIFGFTREEVVGRGFEGLPYPEEFVRPRIEMVRRALAGEASRADLEALRKDGQRIVTELRTIPFLHHGEPHVLQIARDITERKRAEKDRHTLEAQLRQAQKMEAIGHLAGGIAHDFNNILTGILGYIVLAGEREAAAADPKLRQYLDRAQQASLRARDLIQQMLTFSRGRRGEPRPLDLPRSVHDALKLIGATLPSSMVIDVDLDSDVPAVIADPVQVEQVLLNLLINARDATRGAGGVAVQVGMEEYAGAVCASCRKSIQGRYVTLAVRDSGSGIAPGVLDRIFDPFFTTKGVGKGSGMGLSMVHGIVHEYGGHIMVESTPGGGATFRVLLPPHDDAQADVATAAGAPSDRTPGTPPLSGHVLVVDDEAIVGELMAELLASRGLDVTVKSDPVEAMRWFGEAPDRVDLVLTDQTMPRMTGLELARRLTAERPDLPVVLYTGYADDIGPGELRRHGVAAQLRKPVEPAVLVELLRSHLARA
jgi:PAS domain S-box-containing protein